MLPFCLGPSLIPKAWHESWHPIGVQLISAELMCTFHKQIREFLLESTLALSLSRTKFPAFFTFCTQSCLFY